MLKYLFWFLNLFLLAQNPNPNYKNWTNVVSRLHNKICWQSGRLKPILSANGVAPFFFPLNLLAISALIALQLSNLLLLYGQHVPISKAARLRVFI
jgi:hypothetical protein